SQAEAALGPLVGELEHAEVLARERADVRDLDPDRARIRGARVPGLLAEIERLVERPVEVEQEVDRELALVLQHAEARAARAAGVVVQHEEVDLLAQVLERPAVALHGRGELARARLAPGPVALARLAHDREAR